MLRPALAAALLLSVPAIVVAQDDTPAAGQQDPQAAYNALAKSFAKEMNKWQTELQDKVKQARASGARLPRSAYRQPTKEFIDSAQEYAQQYAGKEEAVMFLGFILKNASTERNAVKWAVKTLASDHAGSKSIGEIVDYLPRVAQMAGRSANSLLDDIADNHSDNDTRAKALLARSRSLLERDDSAGAIADLEKVKGLTKDEDMLEEAAEALVEVKKLAVGSPAPEIEGVDVDGVAFKLSDYRGKVVLLDFWGFW